MKSQNGWICLHRTILLNCIWQAKPFSKGQAWVDLLLKACHTDNKIVLGNKTFFVAEGSLITSEVKLANEWGWSRTKVRAFLKLLECEGMVEKKSNNKNTEINIVNYKAYQNFDDIKKQEKDRKKTGKKPQRDTYNNVNNDNNENNINYIKGAKAPCPTTKEQFDFEGFKNYFNTYCTGFSCIRDMTEGRKRAINNLLKKYTAEELYNIAERANESNFLTGENNRAWKANIDWILKPSNAVKILEGVYDNSVNKDFDPIVKWLEESEKN